METVNLSEKVLVQTAQGLGNRNMVRARVRVSDKVRNKDKLHFCYGGPRLRDGPWI